MVRVFIKGGVWKNSEDEILKAAIMKYGKQQWARVASLLNRKSAKQCKARWNEWLDPSVKKIEWSREEEEKLLHLAKLMPSQWRTIGSLLNGRSATQCQEHYERLLDEAVMNNQHQTGVTQSDPNSATATATAAAAATNLTEGLRRHTFRPGDIDSHPETKPARPDPIDMDEDEIEMLQEARARLANTQGKKAKRKQREKILNEAKRLADLQKRRELKQAGLLNGSTFRKKSRGSKREIDLGVEIPFHKPAPAGFHDVSIENEKAESIRQHRLKKVNFQKVNENQFKSRDREAALMQKKEEQRLRSLERSNAALAIHAVSQKNDPIAERKRGILNMPTPNVSDDEYREVAKLTRQGSGMMLPPPNRTPGSGITGVTDALLGDYSDRPLPTPMRTPMNGGNNETPASRVKSVLREASQLRMMERGQTPLLSAANEDTDENEDGSSGQNEANVDIGATPRLGQTTDPFTTAQERATINQTPSNASVFTTNTTTTARRDELGLNRPTSTYDDSVSVTSSAFFSTAGDGASTIGGVSTIGRGAKGGKRSMKDIAREERRAAKRARMELELALKSLPAPQFEYELAVPDIVYDDDNDEHAKKKVSMVKDAADVEREELEQLRKEAEKKYEEQSTVLKRKDLPRPIAMNISKEINDDYMNSFVFLSSSEKDDEHNDTVEKEKIMNAAKLIAQEMMILVQHDTFANPPETSIENDFDTAKKKKSKKKSKKKKKSKSGVIIEPISDEYLESAKKTLEKETESMIKEQSNHYEHIQNSLSNATPSNMLFIENDNDDRPLKWLVRNENNNDPSFSKKQRINSLQLQFNTIKNASTLLQKKSNKIKAKLDIKNGGYSKLVSSLSQDILQSFAEIQHSKIEELVYTQLMENEETEIIDRVGKMQTEITVLENLEAKVKAEYEETLKERDRLWVLKNSTKDDKETIDSTVSETK